MKMRKQLASAGVPPSTEVQTNTSDPSTPLDEPFGDVPHDSDPHIEPIEDRSPKRARTEYAAGSNDDEEAGGLPKNPFVDEVTSAGAGTPKGKGRTLYEEIDELRKGQGKEDGRIPCAPFESEEEWDLAQFLVTSSLSQGEIQRFLNLDIVSM